MSNLIVTETGKQRLEVVSPKNLVLRVATKPVTPLSLTSFPASVPLSGHQAVYLSEDGTVQYASASEAAQVSAYAGVTRAAVSAGGQVQVQMSGPITESGWTWTPEQPIFLGEGGALTQTPPSTPGHSVFIIGVAVNATTVLLNPREPILTA